MSMYEFDWSSIPGALPLLAKGMLVTLPFVLLLLDWWPLGRLSHVGDRASAPALVREKLPLLALAAAIIVPLLLEKEPKPLGDEVSVQIPPVDEGRFINRLTGTPVHFDTTSAMSSASTSSFSMRSVDCN